MTTELEPHGDSEGLRSRAEARLHDHVADRPLSAFDAKRLVHELQVHRIELELQNEELQAARAETEAGLARYTELYDFAPIAYVTLTRDGRVALTNLAGARLLGQERARLKGLSFARFVAGSDHRTFKAWLQCVFDGDTEQRCQLQIVVAGLPVRTVQVDAERSQDGQSCRAVLMDITDRRAAEAELREAAARYRQLFEANPHPMWIYDQATLRFVAVNDAAVVHYGYRRDEFLAMTIENIRPSEDVPALRVMTSDATRAPRSHSLVRHTLKCGRPIDVEITSQSIEFDGRPARVVLASDVTERRRSEGLLLESHDALRALLQRIQRTQEEERIRIAREIHDELGQLLTGLKMDLRWLERKLSEPGLPPALNALLDRTVAASALNEQTMATVQRLSAELRPGALDQLGLTAALAQRARQFEQRTGIICELQLGEAPLPPGAADELYYICQEALTNVARHAQANHVKIQLRVEDDSVCLEVEDDGIGIALAHLEASNSLGLLGMRERALHCGGTVRLERAAPRGTRVVVQLPLPPAKPGMQPP